MTSRVVVSAQGQDLLHVVLIADHKGSFGVLLELDLVLHGCRLLEILRILHVHLCSHEGKHIATTHGVFGEGVSPRLVGDQRDPVFIIDHLENLITIGVGQHHSGRIVEIQHCEGIQRVEIRAQNGSLFGVHGGPLVEEDTHAITTGSFGDLANVVSEDHLRFCKGIIGLRHWGHRRGGLFNPRCRAVLSIGSQPEAVCSSAETRQGSAPDC